MRKVVKAISGAYEALSIAFLIGIAIVVVLQVFFRYVARIIVPWTEEFARYLCIWMVFMGVATAVFRETHIRITFLLNRLSGRAKNVLVLFSYLVMFMFNIIIFFGSIRLIQLNWGQEAVTFPISVGVLYLAITVSSGGIFVFLIFLLRSKAKAVLAPQEVGEIRNGVS